MEIAKLEIDKIYFRSAVIYTIPVTTTSTTTEPPPDPPTTTTTTTPATFQTIT